jgi:hypothetical protein
MPVPGINEIHPVGQRRPHAPPLNANCYVRFVRDLAEGPTDETDFVHPPVYATEPQYVPPTTPRVDGGDTISRLHDEAIRAAALLDNVRVRADEWLTIREKVRMRAEASLLRQRAQDIREKLWNGRATA